MRCAALGCAWQFGLACSMALTVRLVYQPAHASAHYSSAAGGGRAPEMLCSHLGAAVSSLSTWPIGRVSCGWPSWLCCKEPVVLDWVLLPSIWLLSLPTSLPALVQHLHRCRSMPLPNRPAHPAGERPCFTPSTQRHAPLHTSDSQLLAWLCTSVQVRVPHLRAGKHHECDCRAAQRVVHHVHNLPKWAPVRCWPPAVQSCAELGLAAAPTMMISEIHK